MESPPDTRTNWLRQWVLRGLGLAVSRRRLLIRANTNAHAVYLTFDDGPDPVNTPRILDVLRRHQVRATFFVVGEKAAEQPQLLRRVADAGHAIGGHSYFHREPSGVSSRQLINEVRQTDAVLQEITGRPAPLFRPPWGKLTLGKLWRLWADRRTVVLWNKDPRDFAATDVGLLAEQLRASPLAAGDIVLLHDTASVTADVLDELIVRTRGAGLDFAPLG